MGRGSLFGSSSSNFGNIPGQYGYPGPHSNPWGGGPSSIIDEIDEKSEILEHIIYILTNSLYLSNINIYLLIMLFLIFSISLFIKKDSNLKTLEKVKS